LPFQQFHFGLQEYRKGHIKKASLFFKTSSIWSFNFHFEKFTKWANRQNNKKEKKKGLAKKKNKKLEPKENSSQTTQKVHL